MIRILRPDHRLVLNARLNLAHTYKELSRTQEARTLLEHNMEILAAKRYDSMRLLSLGTLAETHFSAGEHEKAKPLIEEYLDLGPQSTQEARQYLGYFRELREKNENEITKGTEVTTGAI
jgi:tetratricopeptide (TPR) repeat protein